MEIMPHAQDRDAHENRIYGAIAYLPFLFLVPLITRPHSSFAQLHGKQGLMLFIAWFGLWIVGLIPLVGLVSLVGYLVLMIVAIIAIVRAAMGQRWEIPLVAKYAKRFEF